MNSVQLYDYQHEMLERIVDALKEHRSVMMQMPTGTGKTHVLAAVVKDFIDKTEGTVWIVAHRRELVSQIERTLERREFLGGIREGKKQREAIKAFSIQWLNRHCQEIKAQPSLIVIDEAHHAKAKTYSTLWEKFPKARFLGLTATPCRMDGRGFTDLFDTLITSWSIAEFIEKGYLSLFDYVAIKQDGEEQRLIESLQKRGADGDYQISEMDRLLNRHTSIERLYRSVEKFARGKKGIMYAISISHARAIAEYYNRRGIKAVAIDSHTPANVRNEYIERFKDSCIDVIVNVDIFSEGFDCPDVGFVQMARPTLSLAKYLQQAGRGLRKTEGKETCVMIDNVGLCHVFGLPTVEWDWEAMFRGLAAGKASTARHARKGVMASKTPMENTSTECDMEMIVEHDKLLEIVSKDAQYVYSIPEWLSDEGRISFVGEGLVKVGVGYGAWYYDIRNGNEIGRKHGISQSLKIMHFGNIEILCTGNECYTRTRLPMMFTMLPHRNVLESKDKRVEIHCWRNDLPIKELPWKNNGFYTVCIFDDEPQEVYVLYKEFKDGRFVVYKNDNYWLCEKGKARKKIHRNSVMGNGINAIIHKLEKEAEKRMKKDLETITNQLLEETTSGKVVVKPFSQSMRWGLRSSAGRVIVPAIYRKVHGPIGGYCTFMNERCDYGVMTIGGKIVVEPRYMKAELQNDGTVNLMKLPGKWEKVRLRHH